MAERRNDRRREETDSIQSKTISINRVTKVVKGGRTMRFTALVVVGDGNGSVGLGLGKAAEVPEAIEKATQLAKRSMIKIATKDTTIPHRTIGKFGRGSVLLIPAKEGTGVIAGGPVRLVLEVSGIQDIRTKSLGTSNPINCAKATIAGLKSLRNAEEIAALRGVDLKGIVRGVQMAKKSEDKSVKITLVKSTIGCLKKQKATVEALGLKKIGSSSVLKDTEVLRGMINVVSHLVKVEEA